MIAIVTDVEGGSTHRVQPPEQSRFWLWRVCRPTIALFAVSSFAVLPVIASPGTGQAATVSSLQAQATALQQQIQAEGVQLSTLSQKYDQAVGQLAAINNQITATKQKIIADQHTVTVDQNNLRNSAVFQYMTYGSEGQVNPLFSGNQRSIAAAQEYGQVATGNLDTMVADLHTAQNLLNAAAAAQQQASQQQAALQNSLSQVKGQLGDLERQAQAQANAQQGAVTRARLTVSANFPAPPPNSAGGRAVAAAESQLGVPYSWGAESPGSAFDCSGLTAWAWGQAGVSLPHYSGGQMSASAPVPVNALEPGDLLFYGPGGSSHVAMYIGGGQMIEAPYTGEYVWVTALRLGDGFVGAGRP
jgi:cell wall-associated NlpC family hydrolase